MLQRNASYKKMHKMKIDSSRKRNKIRLKHNKISTPLQERQKKCVRVATEKLPGV